LNLPHSKGKSTKVIGNKGTNHDGHNIQSVGDHEENYTKDKRSSNAASTCHGYIFIIVVFSIERLSFSLYSIFRMNNRSTYAVAIDFLNTRVRQGSR